jgi:hypothetical protein
VVQEERSAQRRAAEQVVLARRLAKRSGELTTAATTRMDETLPWFHAIAADQRSSVGLIAQAGVDTFITWLENPDTDTSSVVASVFSSAPRDLARAISLQQTVELLRTTMQVVEESIDIVAGDNASRRAQLREELLRYSREVAFAAAEVYARAAESRGAWDARLQDLVLEGILANESSEVMSSRLSAIGWQGNGGIAVLIGPTPTSQGATELYVEQIYRTAKNNGLEVLVAVHSNRMIVIVGNIASSAAVPTTARLFVGHFGSGNVVYSRWGTSIAVANELLEAATNAYRALTLQISNERLISSDELVAGRILLGDDTAKTQLVSQIASALSPELLTTLSTYLELHPSIEACAKSLFVHVNTVRYRLKRVCELTGLDPNVPQDALILRLALMLLRAKQASL